MDFSTCHHDAKEGFQEESDFTYLKKLYRDGLQKTGKARSLQGVIRKCKGGLQDLGNLVVPPYTRV